ncbi:MAG: acyl-CoA thioesterase [Halieaceae bacterium]|jgi:4-hydroxybenzoyl-CoA thioesterase|nr:acyl-CoA thioesterase [Halieaceae bacterium]
MLEVQLEIFVEWGHCDPAKIVFNPNFFIWMESGMHRLFSTAGHTISRITDSHPLFRGVPLLQTQANFQTPAKLGDTITLATCISRFGNTSFEVCYRFFRGEDVLCTAVQTRVWCYAEGEEQEALKPAPIPESVRVALSDNRQVCIKLVSD